MLTWEHYYLRVEPFNPRIPLDVTLCVRMITQQPDQSIRYREVLLWPCPTGLDEAMRN